MFFLLEVNFLSLDTSLPFEVYQNTDELSKKLQALKIEGNTYSIERFKRNCSREMY